MTQFSVEHSSPLAAWGQVTRDLRRRIDQGEMTPGARLSTERELSEQYGVSRITIRQALDNLSRDGYIQRRQGSGTFVSDRVVTVQHDLRLTTPWRDRLHQLGHSSRSQALETAGNSSVPTGLARDLQLEVGDTEMLYFKRLQLVDDAPIGITESWVPAALAPDLRDRPLIDGSLSTTLRERLGLSSHSVDNFLEVGIANSAEATLFESYLDVPLFIVKATSRLEDGRLLEVSRTSWLGSRVRFHYSRDESVAVS